MKPLKLIIISYLLIAIIGCSSGERLTAEERMEQRHQAHIESIMEEDVSGITERRPEMIGGQETLYRFVTYPANARRNEIQGTVLLMVTVNEFGIPEDIKVERSVHRELDRSAVAAMEQMLFKPAVKNGERVPVQIPQPVIFRLALY